MWTSSVLFLSLLISSLSESSTNNLQSSGVKLLTSVRVTSAEECNQICNRVSDQDGLRCNWVVMEEKEKLCFCLHCLDLTVCKLAPVEDVRALQAGKISFINNFLKHVRKKRKINGITENLTSIPGTLSVTTPTSMPTKERTAASVADTTAAMLVTSNNGTNTSMIVTSSNSTNTSMAVTSTNASMAVTTNASTPEVETKQPPITNWTVRSNNSPSSKPEASNRTHTTATNSTVATTSVSTETPLASNTAGGYTTQSVTIGATKGASTASTKSVSLSIAAQTTAAGETKTNLIESTSSPIPSEATPSITLEGSFLKTTLLSSSPTSAIHTTVTNTPTTILRTTALSTTQTIKEKTTATTKQGDKTKTSNSTSRIPSTSKVATEIPETKLKTTAASSNTNEYLFPFEPTVAIAKYLANHSLLIAVLTLGLICFLISILLFIQKAYDSYKRKDYVQVDYLINGMYADSDM